MQQPIATNDVILFSTLRENQYFDRKSARKDDKEIAKHIRVDFQSQRNSLNGPRVSAASATRK